MPRYDYACSACKQITEVAVSIGTARRMIECECGGVARLKIGADVNIAPSALENKGVAVRAINTKEGRWDRDMPAYHRMRMNGMQPPSVDGSADLEGQVTDQFDVKYKRLMDEGISRERIQDGEEQAQEILEDSGDDLDRAARMTPVVNLLYVHSNHMGYGRMGVNIARELEAQGVEVFDHLQGTKTELLPTGHAIVRNEAFVPAHLNTGRKAGRCNIACWLSVPGHGTGWWEGQTPIVFTMWEGMRLPESFRESLHRFDTIVVPSEHNLELFSQFHDKVRYVPLGIDPEVWHYEDRMPSDRFFRFLIGGSGKRKGTDVAHKAFKKLWGKEGSWGDGPIPLLVMKNPKAEQFSPLGGRLQVVAGRITDEEEVDLYRMAHCYLQPSRGEGFGLQPLQAIAQGIPTILTDAHGHKAFSHLGIPLSWAPKKADYFIYGDAGDWWEPDFDELCDAMQSVYTNYADHLEFAKRASVEATATLTWERTARGLIDVIGVDRMTPYVGEEKWYETDRMQFKVITNRDWPCEIAGSQMFFERGVEYWQMADVKRILFEAGVLDPRCLDDDDPDNSGLTEAQIAKAGKYRAQYSGCPNCGKPLTAP